MLHEIAHDLPHPFRTSARLTKSKGRRGDIYTCHLEVFSDEGVFIEESTSTDPLAAIDGVENKLKRQVLSWHLRRRPLGPPELQA
jgi:ribosome-associated translation inhibitor RaiA